MKRSAILTACAVLAVLAGCEPRDFNSATVRRLLDTAPQAMRERLLQENSVVSVEPWSDDYGDGLEIRTEHYRIFTTLVDPLILRQLPAFMESAHAAYQAQLPQPIESAHPFTVYLFADREQWKFFTWDFAGGDAAAYLRIQKGAYALKGACVAFYIGPRRTFSALGHEGWHQFIGRHSAYRLPSWLDEGIATQFESFRQVGGRFEFLPDRNAFRIGMLRNALETSTYMPLSELLLLNPGRVMEDTESLMAFYSQAYALVRFLQEDSSGRYAPAYRAMLLDGVRGRWPFEPVLGRIAADRNLTFTDRANRAVSATLFDHYFDEDLARIDREFITYCSHLSRNVRIQRF